LITVFTTKEYSPEQLEEFEKAEKEQMNIEMTDETAVRTKSNFITWGIVSLVVGAIMTAIVSFYSLEKELYILGVGAIIFGVILFISEAMSKSGKTSNGFYEIMDDLFHLPKTMKQLAVVQFFSWFALFAMWIYSTSAVTEVHFGSTDPASKLYNDGADWVGIMFAMYNLFAALVAFALPVLANLTSRKITHMLCLVAGGLGLISYMIFKDPNLLLVSMLGVGVAWASILSMPYAILTGALPAKKMGVYMGIFNFFIVIPQILAASILGFMVKNLFEGQPIYALMLGGASMILAGLITLTVYDPDEKTS
ncbi:MAG: MFS transporter, partial [Chitinophagales bacterium]|nr:MFS transporter [Chitinophagales bacterium]